MMMLLWMMLSGHLSTELKNSMYMGSGELMVLMVILILLNIRMVLVGGVVVKDFTIESNVDTLQK